MHACNFARSCYACMRYKHAVQSCSQSPDRIAITTPGSLDPPKKNPAVGLETPPTLKRSGSRSVPPSHTAPWQHKPPVPRVPWPIRYILKSEGKPMGYLVSQTPKYSQSDNSGNVFGHQIIDLHVII